MQKKYVIWKRTGNPEIPATVTLGENTTQVWLQAFWKTGADAYYIRHNGCGHCCTAMAANLRGLNITPEQEYAHCLELWGQPDDSKGQEHFISANGIALVLHSFGIPAEVLGVPENNLTALEDKMRQALDDGKQIIFWSHPSERLLPNPFSTGEHYVMAVGYAENGKIVIANSGNRVTSDGVQLVDWDTVIRSLFWGCAPQEKTWGEGKVLEQCGGIVIVG